METKMQFLQQLRGRHDQDFGFDTLDELVHEAEMKEPRFTKKQYISPVCYGRGLRLSDMDVPHIPGSCLHLLHQDQTDPDLVPYLRRRGRGRARALKNDQSSQKVEHRPGVLATPDILSNGGQADVNESSGDSSFSESRLTWEVRPPSVVEFSQLPASLGLSDLYDLVADYGTILQCEERTINKKVSVRFKMGTETSCSSIVTNLDGSDCFDSGIPIRCSLVQS